MYPTSSEGLNKETDEAVYFFTPAFHPFDSFSAHRINIWGQKFATAEHAFQWKKFSKSRPDISALILEAPNPEAAKQISIDYKQDMPEGWHKEKVAVMEEIFTAKAEQNLDVQEALKRSGNRQIIENSPVDSFWGIGPNGDGQNMVGKLWMKIRDKLFNN
jgi:ribA/ribD-fused uncharacterized protein